MIILIRIRFVRPLSLCSTTVSDNPSLFECAHLLPDICCSDVCTIFDTNSSSDVRTHNNTDSGTDPRANIVTNKFTHRSANTVTNVSTNDVADKFTHRSANVVANHSTHRSANHINDIISHGIDITSYPGSDRYTHAHPNRITDVFANRSGQFGDVGFELRVWP